MYIICLILYFTEMTKEKTKSKIEKTALNLIDRKPFQQISTKEIAYETGIAEVTLFRHFKNKEKILDTLADKFFSLIIGFENKNILTEVEFKNELIKFFNKSISRGPIQRKLFKIFLYIGMYRKDKFLKYSGVYENQIASPIEKVVEYGKKNWGYKQDIDTEIAVKLLINSIGFFHIIQNVFLLREQKPYNFDKVVEIAVNNFIKNLK